MSSHMEQYLIPEESLALVRDDKRLTQALSEGKTLQKIIGWSNTTVKQMYEAAARLAEQGSLEDAADAFLFLCSINPRISSFWIGAGLCAQQQGKLEEALHIFRRGIAHACDEWSIYAHALHCCLDMKRRESALALVELALYVAEMDSDDPRSKELKRQAEPWKAYLESKKEV